MGLKTASVRGGLKKKMTRGIIFLITFKKLLYLVTLLAHFVIHFYCIKVAVKKI